MRFYDTSKKEVSSDDFVSMYADSYYIGNEKLCKRAPQSSTYTEQEIDCILCEGIKTPLDVVHILAWKIGKIKHKDSTDRFVYAKDWVGAESFKVYRYKKEFDIKTVSCHISDNIERLEAQAETDPQGVLNELKDLGTDGIGTVYLVTLLYFISRGKYPIYDRFAKIAVDAIIGDKRPGEAIVYKDLPDKKSKAFDTLYDEYLLDYSRNLYSIFKDEYKENRDIDRALWVYGHCFSQNKGNG